MTIAVCALTIAVIAVYSALSSALLSPPWSSLYVIASTTTANDNVDNLQALDPRGGGCCSREAKRATIIVEASMVATIAMTDNDN